MANLREVALGIVQVLGGSSTPEPLPITFRGQSIDEAAELLRYIAEEADDAHVPLLRVTMDPVLFSAIIATIDGPSPSVLDGLTLEPDEKLVAGFELHRR